MAVEPTKKEMDIMWQMKRNGKAVFLVRELAYLGCAFDEKRIDIRFSWTPNNETRNMLRFFSGFTINM
ncbi:MAG: hypothetical protein HY514_05140 [Candidatus Aenigmarchaeota archaeon]|nr:hypothetical protein [Candidatus Aenigmarchaeota archaeon]